MTRADAVLDEMLRSVEAHALDEMPYCRESLRLHYGDMADHPEVVDAIARRRAELSCKRAKHDMAAYRRRGRTGGGSGNV